MAVSTPERIEQDEVPSLEALTSAPTQDPPDPIPSLDGSPEPVAATDAPAPEPQEILPQHSGWEAVVAATSPMTAEPTDDPPLGVDTSPVGVDRRNVEQAGATGDGKPVERPAIDPWSLPSLSEAGFGSDLFGTGSFGGSQAHDVGTMDALTTEEVEGKPPAAAGTPSRRTGGWHSLRQVRTRLRDWFTDTIDSLRDETAVIEDDTAHGMAAAGPASAGDTIAETGFGSGLPQAEPSFLESSFSLPPLSLGDPPPAPIDTGNAPASEAPEWGDRDDAVEAASQSASPTLPPLGPPAPAPATLNDLRAWLPDPDSGKGLPRAS
jgi:hypothetical protein